MKNTIITLFFCLFAWTVATAQTQVPEAQVKDLSGKSIDLKDYLEEGKNYVFSFWATWCSPCKRELDAISELYPDWQEDYNVEIIAITIDNARALAKVKPMVLEKGWEYTIFSDANQKLYQAMNVNTVPQTFVVNGKGEVVYSHTGYMPGDEYELEDKLAALSEK